MLNIPNSKVLKSTFNKLIGLLPLKSLAFLAMLFVTVFSGYHIYFAKRVIPGVYVGNINLSGKTYEEARAVLAQELNSLQKDLAFKNGDDVFMISAEDIGLEYKIESTLARVFLIGRTKTFFVDSRDKIAGLLAPIKVVPSYDLDDALLGQQLATIRAEVMIPAKSAAFYIGEDSTLEIAPSETGIKVAPAKLYDLIISSFNNLSFGEKHLPMEEDVPLLKEEDLATVKKEVSDIVFSPFKLIYERREWAWLPQDKLDFLTFDKKRNALVPQIKKSKLDSYEELLGFELNKPPRGKVTEVDGEKVVTFEIVEKGLIIDTEKFSESFEEAFLGGIPELAVPMRETGAPENAKTYGIAELLGEGISRFSGSSSGRIKNLTLAAERTSGIIVAPGDAYSFNDSVGAISAATGYDSAYIIAQGRTVLGEGGGVCQTSTTLFRAVLNAGLPIITRHPHAYRVSYYEIGSPVGFDASIYQPSLDFQFKNDTPKYILVQSSWDLSTNTLVFRIYGTPDGREVEISKPVVSNVSPPPEPLYQDDPDLPKGTVKQIDFAAWGADVFFTRVVKRNGEVLYEDVFSSKYRPWRAVFLKGTKD